MDKYLDEQLKRPETEIIDYYLVHALNHSSWATLNNLGITEFLNRAIKNQKIKYTGFPFHDNSDEAFKGIIEEYNWPSCQNQCNYLDEEY